LAHSNHARESSETSYKNNRPPKVKQISDNMVKIYVWELPVRIWHWINAGAILALMITGLYIGNPFFASVVQEEASSFIMGWVRYIHFFAAFLFTANLIVRLYWMFTGNKYATSNILRKVFWKDTWETVKFYIFLKNEKPHFVGHNPLAQLSYWAMIGGGSVLIILTGFYLYIEPQPESFGGMLFGWVALFGDSFDIRLVHHIVAWVFIIFTVIHVYLCIREDYLERNGTMSSIFTGYKTEHKHTLGETLEKQLTEENKVGDKNDGKES